MDGQTHSHTDIQTVRWMDRKTDRQTNRQADRQADSNFTGLSVGCGSNTMNGYH